jgi:hypothetical protein
MPSIIRNSGKLQRNADEPTNSSLRPLRYSINVTLDACCDHRAIPADENLHRHAVENLDQADENSVFFL